MGRGKPKIGGAKPKTESEYPIYLSPPGGNIDWEKIETAARVRFTPGIRSAMHYQISHRGMVYWDSKSPAEEGAKERRLLRSIENRCLAATEALREYQKFCKEADNVHALYGIPQGVDISLSDPGQEVGALQALMRPQTADDIESIAQFARAANERWPTQPKGRPSADGIKFLIHKLYIIFRQAGGKGASYYSDGEQKYKGDFLEMMSEILRQMKYPIQSRNALGQLIDKQLKGYRLKDTKALLAKERKELREANRLSTR